MDTRQITEEEADAILAMEETHFRDVKAREIKPAKLSQSISAFANTAGGELFIGIAEKRQGDTKTTEWIGFQDQEAANPIIAMLEGLGGLTFTDATFLECPGRPGYVLHLLVQKTRQVVYSTDGVPYVRRGAQKLPVNQEDALKRLRLDKGIASFEDELVKIPLDLITNSITTLDFLLSEVPTAEPDRWLKSQLLIQGENAAVAGVLLFTDEPQAILPRRSAIKIFRYKTVEEDLDRDALVDHELYREEASSSCGVARRRSFVVKVQADDILGDLAALSTPNDGRTSRLLSCRRLGKLGRPSDLRDIPRQSAKRKRDARACQTLNAENKTSTMSSEPARRSGGG